MMFVRKTYGFSLACFGRISVFHLAFFFSVVVIFLILPASDARAQGLLRQRQNDDNTQNPTKTHSSEKNPADIPWDELDETSKRKIRDVINNKTIFRQMPQQTGYCDRELYDFLISHPDVVIELWELLGVTQISLKETAENEYLLKEGTATTSRVEVLYKSENLCLAYAVGEYDAPMMVRKIKGDVVLVLRSRFGRDKNDRPVVQSNLDAYVRIHNPGAEMLAKMLTPVVGKIADSNFEQVVGFILSLSDAAQQDCELIQSYAERMQSVRREVAEEFALVAETAFDREIDRFVALSSDEQKQLSELVRQSTSPETARRNSASRYEQRIGLEIESQEHAFAQSTVVAPYRAAYRENEISADEMIDELLLPVPGETAIHFEERFIPYEGTAISPEMSRDRMQIISPKAPDVPKPSVSSKEISPTPRPLSITHDDRVIENNSPPKANTRTVSPAPGTTSQNMVLPIPNLSGAKPVKATRSTIPSQNDRVVITTISPGSAVKSNSRQAGSSQNGVRTPRPANQFGTTTPVISNTNTTMQ